MATSGVPATRIKKNDLILLEGQGDEIFRVKNFSISSPGKHGHSKVRILYDNLLTGSGGEVTYSGHKEIEKPVIEKERAQVISIVPSVKSNDPKVPDKPAVVQLMHLETFETYELEVPEEIPEETIQTGSEMEVRFFESKKWIERIVPA